MFNTIGKLTTTAAVGCAGYYGYTQRNQSKSTTESGQQANDAINGAVTAAAQRITTLLTPTAPTLPPPSPLDSNQVTAAPSLIQNQPTEKPNSNHDYTPTLSVCAGLISIASGSTFLPPLFLGFGAYKAMTNAYDSYNKPK